MTINDLLEDLTTLINKGFSDQSSNLELISLRLDRIEESLKDHETRIRAATEGVTQFKFFSGGSGFLSLISIIKSFFE